MNKDSEGFLDRDYIKTLEPREIIRLFIRETSYQETLNVVRNVAKDAKDAKDMNEVNKKTS